MRTAILSQRRGAICFLVILVIGVLLYARLALYTLERTSAKLTMHRVGNAPAVVGDLTDLVNVFIGTTGGGHVFPGATLPHGMVKAGMDTDSPNNHAGYDADPRYSVTGFSQLHDDGTGGNIPLSNFKLFPLPFCGSFTTCPTTISARKTLRQFKYAIADFAPDPDAVPSGEVPDDAGSPGYFATNLSTGVRAELTATRRTALHRYTFPSRAEAEAYGTVPNDVDWRPRIIVDITNDGMRSGNSPQLDIDPETGRVTGSAHFSASFGTGSYRAFVCVDFRSPASPSTPLVPAEYGAYHDWTVSLNSTSLINPLGEQGALLTFSHPTPLPPVQSSTPMTILARVGVSLVSASQACTNAESEVPDFDFGGVREKAREAWNALLGRFEISADLGEEQRNEATLMASFFPMQLYRSHIVPADYSGENPLWESDEPYYDSLYCNDDIQWDTYRTLFPLMSLHDPETYSRIVRSFIDIQQHEGWLPECRGATVKQFIQGGSSGDPILAEFYIKYQKHMEQLGVSSEALYAALVKDAEEEPDNWNLMGRQASLWKEFGYIPSGERRPGGMTTRQVSRTLEYSFGDFAISQVARGMGVIDDWQKYSNRSRGFELVWNPETTINDGFMQPRYARNDSFGYTDPRHCTVNDPKHSSCFLDSSNHDGFYEGGPIVYSQYVPHDTAKLVELQGGRDAFLRRLDFIFDNGYFDSTNEPSQQIPFMYHYADRPGLSTERSRETIARSYNTSVNGLPGNDDSGAMGSYVVFNMLGLYPLPATREFLVSSPYFRTVRVYNPVMRTTTTINARWARGNPADGRGGMIYVKSIRINGQPWHSNCYIEWIVFEIGATVDLELTDDRTGTCGAAESSLPPSLSTGGYGVLYGK
ncbi:glycoside hydrolase family 92 protein [Phellopilus nigrolimitatus]|nr:glycoside hydrolase family 92 protein [Phellopilus nigrolimitatus]